MSMSIPRKRWLVAVQSKLLLLLCLLIAFPCHAGDAATEGDSALISREDTASSLVSSFQPWSPEQFPNRPDDAVCHAVATVGDLSDTMKKNDGGVARCCDPDGLLTMKDRTLLHEALQDDPNNTDSSSAFSALRHRNVIVPATCGDNEDDNSDQDSPTVVVKVQYAVALVKKMDLTDGSDDAENSLTPAQAAPLFGRHIHDTWGVGMETPCGSGSTGVLIFVSDRDRQVYFSRGAALEHILTDARLDRVIHDMKPFLAKGEYGAAVLLALSKLDEYLVAGAPEWKERVETAALQYAGHGLVVGFLLVFLGARVRQQRQQREYATVQSHLNDLDRARAQALQGQFCAQKTCPICLEPFPTTPTTDSSPEAVTTPLMSADNTNLSSNDDNTSNREDSQIGSDGLPLRLLRCGHVFDETCFSEWVSSGHHGKVGKCPICNQDIGSSGGDSGDARSRPRGTTTTPTSSTPTPTGLRRRTTTGSSNSNSEEAPGMADDYENENNFSNSGSDQSYSSSRAMEQYTRDRNFRLRRIALRYPQYVRPQQIQEWSRSGYDGSLARDPTFVERDPVRQAEFSSRNADNNSAFGGTSSSGFGGGSSGGGRGGSW